MTKTLIMYSRTSGCPYMTIAKRVINTHNVPYQEIFIDRDPEAKERVLEWTGFLSVPTLVIANPGETVPYTDFEPLPKGNSPRGVDRGPMLTEGSSQEVELWLKKHGFINSTE